MNNVKQIGTLRSITRYPVKSMACESPSSVRINAHGLEGDRLFAFESSNAPAGMLRLTGPQRRAMLQYQARYQADGNVTVTTPSGAVFDVTSPALLQDFGTDCTFYLTKSETPQTDVRPIAIHLANDIDTLSAQFGSNIDPQRFRSNLVLDASTPLATGNLLSIGPTVVLELLEAIPRCRFITYDPASPIASEPLFDLMRFLDRNHQGRFGMYARVRTPGNIHTGDVASILQPDASNEA